MEITEYTKRAAGEGAEGEARAPKGCPSSREYTEVWFVWVGTTKYTKYTKRFCLNWRIVGV